MAQDYDAFAISNFRTGFSTAVEPWLLPKDAFQILENSHLYRGVVEKILGYTSFTKVSDRLSVALTGTINGSNKVFTGTLANIPSTDNITVVSTVNAAHTAVETFSVSAVDSSTKIITLTSTGGGTGTVNLTTGAVTVTFFAAPVDMTVSAVQYNTVMLTYDFYPATARPVMGIKPYIGVSASSIAVFTDRRMGLIYAMGDGMQAIQQLDYGCSEVPHEKLVLSTPTGFNASTGPFANTIAGAPFVPGTVSLQVFDSTSTLLGTIVDNGCGLLTGSLLSGSSNFINYVTGTWTMTFAGSRAATDTMRVSVGVYGDIFTGDFKNFFSTTNYQSMLFATNAIDPPVYYDGTELRYLVTNLTSLPNTVAPYSLTKVLHIVVNRERLLLIAPYVNNIPEVNSIYWSTAGSPLDFTNDEYLYAPTSEDIKAVSFINSDLVVRFSRSERVFRYTGDVFSPFRWDSTNNLWRCDAPYSAINYDSWFSSVGKPAIVGSDGRNVMRADEIIPDFTLPGRIPLQTTVPAIDQGSIAQCYGERFDDFKEGWLCYRSFDADSITGVKKSNKVLAFNYLDNTYAVYNFPFSCLGFGLISNIDTWGDCDIIWESSNFSWGSYFQTLGALVDLGGDQNGMVYKLGDGNQITDASGTWIANTFNAVTKDFNPFIEDGQLCRLGWVDLLLSTNEDTNFRVQFYKDNELDENYDTYYQETSIQISGTSPKECSKVWKRIYVGAVGKSHTIRFYQNSADFVDENQTFRLHAMILWMKPAGRIFG